MSCNPSIGGVGKGHLVREIDAFDGLMARAADRAAIHRRMLNPSKGPAVAARASRPTASCTRRRSLSCFAQSGVEIVARARRCGLRRPGGRVAGVETARGTFACRAVVIATGTFLDARMFVGDRYRGRPAGERAATALAEQIREIGLGAGAAEDRHAAAARRPHDRLGAARGAAERDEAWTMSALDDGVRQPQLRCAITRTNWRTHEIIRANFDRSPLFAGAIEGRGPRYCPSIEDKVKRFADRDGHQIFLEPEGLDDPLVYPERHFDLAARGRPARVRAHHRGPRAGRDRAARLCGRI